jgi:hypothetical protein
MKKTKIIAILLLLLLLFISSCKDDPVTITEETKQKVIDTVMCDWQFIPFNAYGTSNEYAIYAADTDKVFITSQPGTFFYNGSTFNLIDNNTPEFFIQYIDGINENNVYLLGSGLAGYITHPRLKKWDGNSAYEIQMPEGDSAKFGGYIYAHSNNDIWIATNCNIVYHFDGNNTVTTYYLPVSGHFNASSIFEGLNNEIYLYGIKIINSESRGIDYIFQYSNGNWLTVYSNQSLSSGGSFVNVGNDLLGSDDKYIYYLKPNGCYRLFEMVGFTYPSSYAGISKDDFLCNAYRLGIGTDDMYFYRNGKIYRDTSYKPQGIYYLNNVKCLTLINGYYFGLFESDADYLIVGKPMTIQNK